MQKVAGPCRSESSGARLRDKRPRRQSGFPVERLEDRLLLSGLVISEFLASNSEGLTDSDGDASDWIEIYNDSPSQVNLAGWTLTDDAADPGKWTFPAVSIGPNAFL